MSNVELQEVTPDNLHILRNLYTLFRYDLLRYLSDHPGCDLNEHGTFDEGRRSHDESMGFAKVWVEKPGVLPAFLIRCDGRLVGFATLARPPYAHASVDVRMNDFFILNKFWRKGVGRSAASRLFERFPGNWEVLWGTANAPAAAFWESVVADSAADGFEHCTVEETPYYEGGPGLRFVIPGPIP